MRTLHRPLKEWLLSEDPLGIAPAFPREEERGEDVEEVEMIAEEEPSPAKPSTPLRRGRAFWFLLGLFILLLVGGGGVFYYFAYGGKGTRFPLTRTPSSSPLAPLPGEKIFLRFGPFSFSPTLPVPPPQGVTVAIEVATETMRGTIYLLARPLAREKGERMIAEIERQGLPVTFESLPEGSLAIRSLPLSDSEEKRRFQETVATFGEGLRESEGEILIPRYYLWVGSFPPALIQPFLQKLPPEWRNLAQYRSEGPR
jgi:hypothetical protein